MKGTLKILLKWLIWFVICFGGWKLFETNDPVFVEIGVALIMSVFVSIISEVISGLEKRIKHLEEKVRELENR